MVSTVLVIKVGPEHSVMKTSTTAHLTIRSLVHVMILVLMLALMVTPLTRVRVSSDSMDTTVLLTLMTVNPALA